MKIYFNQTSDEDFGIFSENDLYFLFLKDDAWVHKPENYPLWKKINTDATVSDCPRFLCIDTDNPADVDHCSVDINIAKMLVLINNNLCLDGEDDTKDYPEQKYLIQNEDDIDKAYDAYWNITFVSPRNNESCSCTIRWGATEYDELTTALKNIAAEF